MSEDDRELKAMEELCAAIGALVLKGTQIDGKLSEAVVLLFGLREAQFAFPVVAEIETRRKIELLRQRIRSFQEDWRQPIRKWLDRAERVNSARNHVAHHQVVQDGDTFRLFSPQATKLLKALNAEAVDLEKIHEWTGEADAVLEESAWVLMNLARFANDIKEAGLADRKD